MKNNIGSATPALIIIASAFIIAIYGILFVLTVQFEFAGRQITSERALNIAEAGIHYYRWHLKESSEDYQDGTGAEGPYIHDYTNSQGDVIGKFSLTIDPPADENRIITITSTGWLTNYPKLTRTIRARYGQVSLTRYAFLHNTNLWFSTDIYITGPVFSNGGIRQDGTNTTYVESAKETYTCGAESGCISPEEKPGVWGNGHTEELWNYPVAPIDFESIKVKFTDLKTIAQSQGLYLEPSGEQGYHLVFTADGNVTVYKVTGIEPIKGYSLENECENLNENITDQAVINTYPLSENSIIFAEDTIWVDGIVNGKTTVVAARFPLGTNKASIFLTDNITYLAKDGNHKFGLVAEKDVIIGRDVPDNFEMNGAVLAQNGRIIRHHYGYVGCKSRGEERIKNELKFYGSLISDQKAYWNFSSGPKSTASGFVKSWLYYDPTNFTDPPPFFPSSSQLTFLSWEEIR